MIPEIEQLILKRRKIIYKDLQKGKRIKPEAYFIIRTDTGVSEIMIPRAEEYITTPRMKDMFSDFVDQKWREYNGKTPMELVGVVLMSDISYLHMKPLAGETFEEAIARSGPSPCDNPNSIDAINFVVSMRDVSKIYCYPYYRKKKQVTFAPLDEGMLGSYATGRLINIFPKHLKR